MNTFYLSIGSNVEPEKYIPAGIAALKKRFPQIKISTVYETDPVGPAGPHKFWNLAAQIKTDLNREEIFGALREIETALGRTRSQNKFAPRTLDLDLLPQAEYQEQAFIMIPLAEIAAEEKDAETGKTFGEIGNLLRKQAAEFKKVL